MVCSLLRLLYVQYHKHYSKCEKNAQQSHGTGKLKREKTKKTDELHGKRLKAKFNEIS